MSADGSPGKSKPLLVGFARIAASNYDRRTGYICVSQDKLAEQCGMHRRATVDLFKRVVYQHQMFRVVGQRPCGHGGSPIPKLVWQIPPADMHAAGATAATWQRKPPKRPR